MKGDDIMMTKEYINGVEFVIGKSKKFDRDFAKAERILKKKELTATDRMELLSIYNVSFHDDGKIEGAASVDSSCHGCKFCQKMRKAAEKDPTLICGYCYDDAQENRWYNTRNRHGLNLLIMSAVDYTEDELSRLSVSEITRVNSSGETPNDIFARNNIRLANTKKWAHFGYWAKNRGPVKQACEDLGKPANMKLIQSSIHIGKVDKKDDFFDYVFTVYPDEETTLAAIKGGASPCNGKKCIDCGWKCYYGTHKGDQIAEVLRVSEKKRAALVKIERR